MQIVSEETFDAVLETLLHKGVLAVDTETTGLRWAHGADFFSVIVADESEEYYFNWNHWNTDDKMAGVKALPREFIKKLQPLFTPYYTHIPYERFTKERLIVMANAKFDLHMLENAGIVVLADIYDVLVMARIENNTHFQYSLDACAKRIELEKSNKVEEFIHETRRFEWETIPGKKARRKNKLFHRVPLSVIAPYACQDARVTYQLYQHQMEVFAGWEKKRPDNLDPISTIIRNEMALTKTCFHMERIGFQLDVEYVKKALHHEEERIKQAKKRFLELSGKELIDSNKSLVDSIGSKVTAGVTEKGNASFTEAALSNSSEEVARVLLDFRDATKRCSSYYQNFLYHADAAGVVHCNIRQSATITGRFSISDPALQTLNAEDEGEWLVRKSFIARDGFRLLAIDYAAFEFRAMLDMANERGLAAKIDAGLDPHQATADMVGISRKEAKTMNFGLLYGMGIQKLADALGVPLAEAKLIRDQYFAALPNVQKFIQKCIYEGKFKGYIWSRFSRKYQCPDPRFAYKMPNVVIQGSTADAIKFAMVRIHKFLNDRQLKTRLILTIHDELLFELADGEDHIIPELKRIMIDSWPSSFHKMGVSVEVGKNWGEMGEYA